MEKLKILNLNFSFQRAAHYHINGGEAGYLVER